MSPRLLAEVSALSLLFAARMAFAYSKGINGYSGMQGVICNACHTGGEAPSVTLTLSGPPLPLNPGDTADFVFTVRSSAPGRQRAAGLDVAASGGTLRIASGQREQVLEGELTHTRPQDNDNSGSASWTFKWKAPAAAGNYILYAAGNSVNLSGTPEGDRAASTVFFVAVGNVTPLPTWTPTLATVVPSPTPPFTAAPPSATPTATSMPMPTATPPPTDAPTATATPVFSQTPVPTDTPGVLPTMQPAGTSTPTDTPTLLATPTTTPSMLPTPVAQPGDANCDGLITAADLPQLLGLLPRNDPGRCGAADANADGSVNDLDVVTTIALIFEPRA